MNESVIDWCVLDSHSAARARQTQLIAHTFDNVRVFTKRPADLVRLEAASTFARNGIGVHIQSRITLESNGANRK